MSLSLSLILCLFVSVSVAQSLNVLYFFPGLNLEFCVTKRIHREVKRSSSQSAIKVWSFLPFSPFRKQCGLETTSNLTRHSLNPCEHTNFTNTTAIWLEMR